MIKEFNREEITVWGGFSDIVNKKCRSENPRIPTFFPIKEVIRILFKYYLGLLPFLPIKDDFFEIPLIRHFFRMPNVVEYLTSWISTIPQFLRFGVPDDVILRRIVRLTDWLLRSPKLYAHLKARGIPVSFRPNELFPFPPNSQSSNQQTSYYCSSFTTRPTAQFLCGA
ncbi:unnamed protein product [Dibothriocephalus latus]|uniref:Uncharacterized protein n=1 Tax=Dibothriocephalus latus TaxID=60516 RepID=A0A3P7R0M0_DIBLA|nr:unnamed protein product [Dibothriocephalus latus]